MWCEISNHHGTAWRCSLTVHNWNCSSLKTMNAFVPANCMIVAFHNFVLDKWPTEVTAYENSTAWVHGMVRKWYEEHVGVLVYFPRRFYFFWEQDVSSKKISVEANRALLSLENGSGIVKESKWPDGGAALTQDMNWAETTKSGTKMTQVQNCLCLCR